MCRWVTTKGKQDWAGLGCLGKALLHAHGDEHHVVHAQHHAVFRAHFAAADVGAVEGDTSFPADVVHNACQGAVLVSIFEAQLVVQIQSSDASAGFACLLNSCRGRETLFLLLGHGWGAEVLKILVRMHGLREASFAPVEAQTL